MDTLALDTDHILQLARSRIPADRERLLMTVVDLCEGERLTPEAAALVQDIFMALAVEAEREIRQRLAEKLADAPWAPHALIAVLALDEIEIARPVIARSPVLEDADLVRLVVEATLEHQIEVARRPKIGESVVTAIIDQAQPQAMAALATNETAQVTTFHMQQLVIASRRVAALRGPLARHPALTEDLAKALYTWVGDALKTTIGERFNIDPAKLEQTLGEAVAEAIAGDVPAQAGAVGREQREMELRLVEKLGAAGQLRPGYLLRVLREGRLSLFETALAALGQYDIVAVERCTSGDRADLLALACAGVGIDRSVFPTILSLVQGLNQGRPDSGPANSDAFAAAFGRTPEQAAEAFRAEVAAV